MKLSLFIWKLFLGEISCLPKKLDRRQFFTLISVTQSNFFQFLSPQWVPPDLSLILISVWALNYFHIITCQLYLPF